MFTNFYKIFLFAFLLFLNSFRRRLLNNPKPNPPEIHSPIPATNFNNRLRQVSTHPATENPLRPQPGALEPSSQVSPINDIKANVLRSIQASRPEDQEQMHDSIRKVTVREPQSSYCDTTGDVSLTYLTDCEGIRFFLGRDVTDPGEEVLNQHGAALRRFVSLVINPLGRIFSVNPRSLHCFYDLQGPLIAFNRSGSIFLNLRYYLGWHDRDVQANRMDDALISWFFSLAHEFAHNLVQPHNSEHEFYVSAIAEQHFVKMAALLESARKSQENKLIEL